MISSKTIKYSNCTKFPKIYKNTYWGTFEFEKKIALFNNSLEEIETIFFLTSPNNAFISSSMVREIIENGGNYKKFVPESVSV